MKTAVILHGACDKDEYFDADFPSPSNAHWLPWLQQKFLRSGVLCQTLEMPAPYAPRYQAWRNTFEQIDTGSLSIVVGHSAGGGFILKWLHSNPRIKLDKLVLVAPWLDPFKEDGDFLEFELNQEALSHTKEVHVFASEDDMESVQLSVAKIKNKYRQLILHIFENKGHFCSADIGDTFEELWEICR